jgi:trimethylamine--corrinoid protein Co-methyltransferase
VDVIREVGPFNDFLSHDSTYRHMRSQSQPGLIDRKIREEWQNSGGSDLYQKAAQKAREILETHKPEPLPDNVLSKIRTIVEDTEKKLGVAENHKKK